MKLFHRFFILVVLVFLMSRSSAFGQLELHAIPLSKNLGFNYKNVYDIFQDSNGFIWFGTDKGPVRYDGLYFEQFKNAQQNNTAGSGFQEDKWGRVWFQSFDGQLFYFLQDSLHLFLNKEQELYCPARVQDSFLLHLYKGKLHVYDIASLEEKKKVDILPGNTIPLNYSTQDGSVYTYFYENLIKIGNGGEIEIKKELPKNQVWITKMFVAGDRIMVVNGNLNFNRYWLLDTQLNLLSSPVAVQDLHINNMIFIDGRYCLLTQNGVWVYDKDWNLQGNYLSQLNVTTVCKDKEGNFWLGTLGDGAFFVKDLNTFQISSFPLEFRFIFPYKKGYLLIDKKGKIFSWQDINKADFDLIIDTRSLVYYAYLDEVNQQLVFSSVSYGTTVLDLKSLDSKFLNIAVKSVAPFDRNFHLFAAPGLLAFKSIQPNSKTSPDFNLKQEADNNLQFPYRIFRLLEKATRMKTVLFEPQKQEIFYADNIGTFRLDKAMNNEPLLYQNQNFFASHIFLHHNQVYFISSKGALFRTQENSNNLLPVDLSFNNDEQILKHKIINQKDYLLSNKNIYVMPPQQDSIQKVLTLKLNEEVNDFYFKGDTLLVLSADGLSIQKLNQGTDDTTHFKAKLFINRVFLDNRKVDFSKEIKIPVGNNAVLIDYAIPIFAENIATTLFYRLDNGEWQKVNNRNGKLEILSLPEGHHQLSFKLDEQIQDVIINFDVAVPFWKTWWFLLLLSVFTAFGVYLFFRIRVQRIKNRLQTQNEKMRLEKNLSIAITKSVKSQMNPHFFYNALNTIKAYIYINDKKNAEHFLNKFSKLTRNILEMTERDLISLKEEIAAIDLYLDLEKMRLMEDFDFEIKVDPSIDVEMVRIPPMLVQPYVENAIKHGFPSHLKGEKSIKINILTKGENIIIQILDNGVGIHHTQQAKHKKHQSFSSQANENRITAFNKIFKQKIEIELLDRQDIDKHLTGTQVTISIPNNLKKQIYEYYQN